MNIESEETLETIGTETQPLAGAAPIATDDLMRDPGDAVQSRIDLIATHLRAAEIKAPLGSTWQSAINGEVETVAGHTIDATTDEPMVLTRIDAERSYGITWARRISAFTDPKRYRRVRLAETFVPYEDDAEEGN